MKKLILLSLLLTACAPEEAAPGFPDVSFRGVGEFTQFLPGGGIEASSSTVETVTVVDGQFLFGEFPSCEHDFEGVVLSGDRPGQPFVKTCGTDIVVLMGFLYQEGGVALALDVTVTTIHSGPSPYVRRTLHFVGVQNAP